MDIDRNVQQGDLDDAKSKIKFCLDMIEDIKLSSDQENKFWAKRIGKRLTYEEVIGALVSAEQSFKNLWS